MQTYTFIGNAVNMANRYKHNAREIMGLDTKIADKKQALEIHLSRPRRCGHTPWLYTEQISEWEREREQLFSEQEYIQTYYAEHKAEFAKAGIRALA